MPGPSCIFFGYSQIGVVTLEALARCGYHIQLVVTHPDDPSEKKWYATPAEWAAANGVPLIVSEGVPSNIAQLASARKPDFIFSAFYRCLLPGDLLLAALRGAYNLHPSLLPRYRGRAPINWVLVNGETETGLTLHRMTRRADAGEIAAQARVPIAPDDTALKLYRKLEVKAATLLDEVLPALAAGTAQLVPQDISNGSCFGRRTPEDGRIDWALPAAKVFNLIRAVTRPWPGAFALLPDGQKFFLWWARPLAGVYGTPGSWRSKGRLAVVSCGEGGLELQEVSFKEETASGVEIPDFLIRHGMERLQ